MSTLDLSGLNDNQRAIVQTLDKPLFVAAGAGSGKTFTLTQRIAWALSPGSGTDGKPFLDDISQILVITFTNAAAREIKERVRPTLRQCGLREQALNVDSAWISTIHGMCSRILKRHALDLNIDPEFSIASENEVNELRGNALQHVVGGVQKKQNKTPQEQLLFERMNFGSLEGVGSNEVSILNSVSKVMTIAAQTPGGYKSLWVPKSGDIASAMESFANHYDGVRTYPLSAKDRPKVEASCEALQEFLALAPGKRTPQAALDTLNQVSMPRSSRGGLKEYKAPLEEEFALLKIDILLGGFRPGMEEIIELAQKTTAYYQNLKRDGSLLDDDDLIAQALQALETSPEVQADYRGRFKLVMIDEFQDTDAQQLKLISYLSGTDVEHLTTVGDAQQSIYRFRGADVGVFRSRGAGLPEDNRVQLDMNYRSHADILSFVDKVCGGDQGVLKDFMRLKANPAHSSDFPDSLPRIDIELTCGQKNVSKIQGAVAAQGIAAQFKKYADAGVSAGNMALLLRAMTNADQYVQAIRDVGLECVVSGGSGFTTTIEAQTMGALLHYLANDHDSETGLFPVLASQMFGLGADDFVSLGTGTHVNTGNPIKRAIECGLETMEFREDASVSPRLVRAHNILMEARSEMRRKPVAEVCREVVVASGWLNRLEEEGVTGQSKEANVLASIDYIRDLTEEMGLGPARAASEFDTWLRVSKISPSRLNGIGSNAVQVMTVHASKGLEFQVVAVAGWDGTSRIDQILHGHAQSSEGTEALIIRADKIDQKVLDKLKEIPGNPQTLGEWYPYLRDSEKQADAEEATRLLYVALTRAEDALIFDIDGYTIKSSPSLSPDLTGRVMGALFGGAVPQAGTSELNFGGSMPAVVHTYIETKGKGKTSSLDTGGLLPELEGQPLQDPADVARLLHGSSEDTAEQTPTSFDLFAIEPDPLTAQVEMEKNRFDVFSFSAAHEKMAHMVHQPYHMKSAVPVGWQAVQESQDETADPDRATNIGSAFHLLAQTIVESGYYPTDEHIREVEDYWGLGERARKRVEAALKRWFRSSIRKEVLQYQNLQAELPFFSKAHSELGSYATGAFDVVAYDDKHEVLLVDYKTGDTKLDIDRIRENHSLQADLYARVLMDIGFERVRARFVCVEREDPNEAGEPLVVAYDFDQKNAPYAW